jgi:trans-2,3-dihydro-3-hydroxyanthranilate isomerase
MSRQYHTADVFTSEAFGGNQLAVLPDATGLSTDQMHRITREFNFSETVFVLPPADQSHARRLRIFTPGVELPFAGHPTVGTAFVLASIGEIPVTGDETKIIFEEGVGPVPVLIRAKNGSPVFAQLTTARIPEKGAETYDPAIIAQALSLDVDDIDVARGIESWSAGLPYLFIPLNSLDALARSRVNAEAWEKSLKNSPVPEVYPFVDYEGAIRARMYAPNIGLTEDPATGSACASLGGYLASRSDIRDGTLRVTVHQGVEMGRPSRLELEVDMKGGAMKAVRVGGASVLVSSGTLHVE